MTKKELTAALANHAFLRGMPAAKLKTLTGLARTVTATSGTYLLRENSPADSFFLIQSGRVAIELHAPDRGPMRIQTLAEGEAVGWSWLVPPYRWQFDARVIEPITALALDAAELRDACAADDELGYLLLKRLVVEIASRLSATRLQLLDVYR